jgi:hypothetical protein
VKDLIAQLRASPEFQMIVTELRQNRPVIPRYVVAETTQERELLIEQIKCQTFKQDGFDLLYRLLTGSNP